MSSLLHFYHKEAAEEASGVTDRVVVESLIEATVLTLDWQIIHRDGSLYKEEEILDY